MSYTRRYQDCCQGIVMDFDQSESKFYCNWLTHFFVWILIFSLYWYISPFVCIICLFSKILFLVYRSISTGTLLAKIVWLGERGEEAAAADFVVDHRTTFPPLRARCCRALLHHCHGSPMCHRHSLMVEASASDAAMVVRPTVDALWMPTQSPDRDLRTCRS